ncbi:MAG TPA: hypothetical protein PLK35_03965 [Candidatus Moranbacteria bacterium]|nr:hypothetical protein [Candidatus Moranbacteria bacterium]
MDNNTEENFDVVYQREIEIHKKLQNIEIAYAKTVDKYRNHENCLAFLDYLKTTEKVFAEAKMRKWNAEKTKNELIEIEISILSSRSNLPKDFFKSIYEDFLENNKLIGEISEAIQRLLKKYADQPECCEFINYVEAVFIGFENIKRGDASIIDLKSDLIKAKMQVLSCDGDPELKLLEEIYDDFQKLIQR